MSIETNHGCYILLNKMKEEIEEGKSCTFFVHHAIVLTLTTRLASADDSSKM